MQGIPDHYVNSNQSQPDYLNDTGDYIYYNHNVYYNLSAHRMGSGYNIVYRVLLPIVLVIGMMGILMTVIVLAKKTMWTSTNCYLTALAVADLFFLIILSTRLLDDIFVQSAGHQQTFIIYFQYAKIVMNASLLASVWLTVVMAAERYTAICRPLHAHIICTVKRARIVIIFIFILSFICRSPNFFEFYIVEDINPQDYNTTIYSLEYTELSDDPTYRSVYTWLVDGIFTAILPFLSLTILNILLIYELRVSTRYMRHSLSHTSHETNRNFVSREEMKITMMLVSIIIVFFLLQAPFVAYNAAIAIPLISAWILGIPGFQIFRYIAIALIALKTAVNFALYCWFSERFWATFKKAFYIDRCVRRYYIGARKHDSNGTSIAGQKYSFNTTRETTM